MPSIIERSCKAMPVASYADLLSETCPEVIESEGQYETVMRRLDELVRKGRARSRQETKLMRLLTLLIQDYDRRHPFPMEPTTPVQRLNAILEESGTKPAALLPIF